jgi:hypothetical protein
LEHGELVAEHQDLCVLGGVVHPEDPQQITTRRTRRYWKLSATGGELR